MTDQFALLEGMVYNAMRELMSENPSAVETSGEYQAYAKVLRWMEALSEAKEKEKRKWMK
jgi:hypothetical protein